MSERMKTAVYVIVTLGIIASVLFVTQPYIDLTPVEPVSEPIVSEPVVYAEEVETEPETVVQEVATAYVEPEQEPEPVQYESTGEGLTASGGVYYYNGHKETWYSSARTAPHYRINEWWLDDEGCWRTDEGYYVVASRDYPEGTVVEISKGQAMVLDSGCASGTIDVYTAW